jgi:uncharacterized protein YraI
MSPSVSDRGACAMPALRVLLLLAVAAVLAGCVSSAPYGTVGREVVTTGSVNMRAGPGTRFPVITTVGGGSIVTVYGCLEDRTWCDTAFGSARGWISSRYLSAFYAENVYVPYRPVYPVVAFDFGYWDTWYTGYSWYGGYPWYGGYYRRYPGWGRYDGYRRNDDLVFYPRGGFYGGRGGRND